MKKGISYFILLLSFGYVYGCTHPALPTAIPVQHADPFYNINGDDYPLVHLPLIKPVEAIHQDGSSSWKLELLNPLWIKLPKSQEQEVTAYYGYSQVEELEKFSVKDGVIVAYSAYVDDQADPFIRDDYYHWFVMVPGNNITKGFHSEDAFRRYMQSLSVEIEDADWLTPDAAFDTFLDTGGCLDWFPDCQKP